MVDNINENLTHTSEDGNAPVAETSDAGTITEETGKESSAAPENMDAAPENMDAAPENMDAAPENMDAAPENMDAAPENMTAAPENMDAAPESMTAAPEDIFAQPYDMTQQNPTNIYGDQAGTVKTKKKKKGLIIGILAAAIIVIAAAVLVTLLLLKKNAPEKVVPDAFEKTFSELEDPDFNSLEAVLGISEMDQEDMDLDMNITLKKLFDDTALEGSELGISLITDPQEDGSGDYQGTLAATINGESASTNVYFLDDKLYYDIPELFNGVFMLDSNTISEALSKVTTDSDASVDTEEVEKTAKELKEKTDKIFNEGTTYDRVGKEEVKTPNGDKIKTTHYTMVVEKETGKDVLSEYSNVINKYIDEYVTDDMLADSGMTVEDIKSSISQMAAAYSMVFTDDFTFDIYVNKEGKIVKLESEYTLSMLGAKLSLTSYFQGDKFVLSDRYTEMKASVNGMEAEIVSTYKQKSKDGKINVNTEVSASLDASDEKLAGKYTSDMSYDTSSEAYSVKETVTGDVAGTSKEYSVVADGKITNVEKGKSYEVVIDDLSIGDSEGTTFIELSADSKIGNFDDGVAGPDSSLDVYTSIDDETMESIMNQEAINKLVSAWKEAFSQVKLPDYILYLFSSTQDAGAIEDESLVTDDYDDGDDSEQEDYSGYVMSSDSYEISINDPVQASRSYASDSEIYLYEEESGVDIDYILTEDVDIDDTCAEYLETYQDYGDDCTLEGDIKTEMKDGDGETVTCYTIKATMYETGVTDIYVFYPLSGSDYLIVNFNSWNGDLDVQDLVDTYVTSDVIGVTAK